MRRLLTVLIVAMLAATALVATANAHQERIPGAIVLNEDVPDRPRCYIFTAPIAAGEGTQSVQWFVETNGDLAGGVPEGTGPTNTRTATLDRTVEGFTGDLDPAPDEVPLKETVVGDGSGLQHPDARFNVASQDPDAAAGDPDEQVDLATFVTTCLASGPG